MGNKRRRHTCQFEKDPITGNAEGNSKHNHEALFQINFSETQPLVKTLNIIVIYYDLYYTVIKKRDEKEEEEGYDVYDVFPKHFVGKKINDDTILRWRKVSSQINDFKLFIVFK